MYVLVIKKFNAIKLLLISECAAKNSGLSCTRYAVISDKLGLLTLQLILLPHNQVFWSIKLAKCGYNSIFVSPQCTRIVKRFIVNVP